MLFRDTVIVALRALRSNKLRSGLTMLGLIIGVAAVILVVSAGEGVSNSVNEAIAPVANNITIVPKFAEVNGGPDAQPLTDADAAALAKAPDVATLTPAVTGSTTSAAGQNATAVLVQTATKKFLAATVTGTTANWFQTNARLLTAGTYFTQTQAGSGAHVAVVGPSIADVLFGSDAAAVGKTIRVSDQPFRVMGVMRDYGANLDNNVVMPEGAARSAIFGYGYEGDQLSQITATATSSASAPAAVREITQILSQRHHVTDPEMQDFQVQTLGARLTTFNQILGLLTGFTPAIGAISLLVGGIGVLNIMLVSVTDRTREIGTRKAIGAVDSAILTQFVLEAVTLSGLGGLIGIAFGLGLIFAVRLASPLLDSSGGVLSTFSPVLSLPPVLVAFVISLAIGAVAGGYPAWRAARLNPIEALRYE
ncbi:MAG TPA: ABC transporter permease [Pseudonocardia sp.]|jgi:putative ABC transport system permease protein|uniref:ABC transporter permease n=1 Tax=Pseudonocardia sp. TaxID=60912 RepID=UPI002CF3FB8D|nr:ABC transporter permease [Pseudonocardia sp.]HTF52030.1 ABC transporter permease [Pseudonocardia sp.]